MMETVTPAQSKRESLHVGVSALGWAGLGREVFGRLLVVYPIEMLGIHEPIIEF